MPTSTFSMCKFLGARKEEQSVNQPISFIA
jgi:hypothetical protein